jgi:hypothetical protein
VGVSDELGIEQAPAWREQVGLVPTT